MAVNDKKMEKLMERAKQLELRIKIEDIEKMIDQLSENTEENDDEEKIF